MKNRFVLLAILIVCLSAIFFGAICAQIAANQERIPLRDPFRQPHWKTANGNANNRGPFYGQPEQVHLSYGGGPSRVFITWLTFDDTLESMVEYGLDFAKLDKTMAAKVDYFLDGGTEKVKRYTHRALLEGIRPGQRYFYRVGSQYGWSPVYSFVGLKERPEGGFKYAVFGDMGNVNARSLGKLQREAQNGDFDIVLHVGDLAYNLDTDQGTFGDEFMRQIEPVAAYVPYMTVVGNHEYAYNFSHFINRFTMPNTPHNLFYSFDIGPAHFIAFSTEFYFFFEYGFQQLANQWRWLIEDLEKANQNRQNVPWIITMGHRPMYCSDFDGDDCTRSAFRSSNYGFSRMHIYNSTHLYFEQTLASNDTVEDSFWLVKHVHRPYTHHDRSRLMRHGTYIPEDYCHHPSQCSPVKNAHL